jgi:excisionase family DNA binding protein
MFSRRLTTDIPGAAELLGVSPRTAYSAARAGALPGAFRLGAGRWLVSLPALEAFLANGREAGLTQN